MNILLCNGKGGTGKTTLTVLLAHALAEAGKKVAVLDRDPQGTATQWIKECESKKVALYDHASKYDAVFIDTPPRLDTLTPALASCSVAVLVCSPSPADIWTTRDTAEAIRPHLPKKARLKILFNGVLANTVLSRELPDLAKRIGVKALTTTISRRQCYQHAALLGWQALDLAAREELFKAALEIVTE
ncbi:MAG: AAA family ATPase [Elusimicrobiales bacterium]|mgnify:FL=1|jgi:chromosome partitioning protein